MNTTLNIKKITPFFLICLFIALMPPFFLLYIAALFWLTKILVVVIIIDLITKHQFRKKYGLILATMYIAAIIAALVFYLQQDKPVFM